MRVLLCILVVLLCSKSLGISLKSPIITKKSHKRHDKVVALRGGGCLQDVVNAMPVGGIKLALGLSLSMIGVKSWTIPFRNKKFTTNDFLLGVTNAFSGGVFFMLAFGHLLPEALEGFANIGWSHKSALLTALGGYMVMFMLDRVIFDAHALAHGVESPAKKGGTADTTTKPGIPKSALTLVGAMSLHSAFENIALGLTRDRKSAGLMFASSAIHQPAESIALMVALIKAGLTRGQVAHLMLLYNCVGFIAIMGSTLLSKFATPSIDAVVMALTTGTFLYVGATEVVNEEFDDAPAREKWSKAAALFAGMATIYAICTVASKIEGGHHHH